MERVCWVSILVCTLFVRLVFGAEGILPGNGTEATPYLIEDIDDFDVFADSANAGVYWAGGVYTKLMCDIDLSGRIYDKAVIAPNDDYSLWEFNGTIFSGVFNGNGYKITGMNIDDTGQPQSYLGLFGFIGNGGIVRELHLSDALITLSDESKQNIGGICGQNGRWNILGGSIIDCHVDVHISGNGNCYNVGGICGAIYHTESIISSCSSTGIIHLGDRSSCIGGICGSNGYGEEQVDGGTIISSFALIDITIGNYADAGIGGVSGLNSGEIKNCYSEGDLQAGNWCDTTGGICAMNFGLIHNCYFSGSASVGENSVAGGICGNNIDNQYITGIINDCFWDTEISNLSSSDGGTGKNTNEMKNIETFTAAGWDFSDTDGDPAVWQMPEKDYPRLAWETLPVKTPYFVTGEYWYGMLESDISSGGVGAHSGQATFTEANISQQFADDAGNDANESVSITDSYVDEDGWLHVELDGGELVTLIPGENLITSINRQVDPENDLSSYLYAKKAIGICEQDIVGEYAVFGHWLGVLWAGSEGELGVGQFYADNTWVYFGQFSDGSFDYDAGTWTLNPGQATIEVVSNIEQTSTILHVGKGGLLLHYDVNALEDDDLGFSLLVKKGHQRRYETAAGRYLYQELITDASNKVPETGWGVLTLNSDGTWSIEQSFYDGSSGNAGGTYLIEDDGTIYFYDPYDQTGNEASLSQDGQFLMLALMGQDGDVGIGIGQRSSDCNGNGIVDMLEIPGDATGDGIVNLLDFAALAENWLDENCGMCRCSDFSCNGEIDFDDLYILTANWQGY